MTKTAKAQANTEYDMEEPVDVNEDQQHEAVQPEQEFDNDVPSWFTRRMSQGDDEMQNAAPIVAMPAPQFKSTYQPLSAAQQADAQDSYRRRLEERFRLAQHMAHAEQDEAHPYQPPPLPPTYAHTAFPQRPVGPDRRFPNHDQGYMAASTTQRAPSALGVSIPVALFLLSVASCVGAFGGYLSANPGVAASMMPTSLASLWPFGGKGETTRVAEVAPKKDIATAKVDVANIEGAVNAPIPLDISAIPNEPGKPLALKISGLPADAYLTKGEQVASGEWLVRAEDIRSAELVVKSSAEPELGLLVTALEVDSGVAAAPAKSMKVALNLDAVPAPGLVPAPEQPVKNEAQIQPVNAPPEVAVQTNLPQAVPAPETFLQDEAASYVEKGEMLLKVGDIIAARQFFMRAYELKSPEGAYGVGRTYDPVVYRDLNVQGLKPNSAKAAEWYGKAAAQGHEAAQTALTQPPQ